MELHKESDLLPAYITHADCARHEMGPHHPECPERLGAINDLLLVKGLLDYMNSYDAPLATPEQLAHAHSSLYVSELMDASPTEGYHKVDPDTDMNPFTIKAALRAAGAAVLATDLVLSGEVPTAFCCVRPPGHHAERAAAMGFCFFNNVAVGIRHALTVHGVERVALIDFDVHHGNGSEDIFRGDDFAPQLIYISAGFDGHREDDMGNLGLVEADYEWVTQQLMAVARRYCQGRVISCLEGGYVLSPLARSAAAHVKVLIGAD
jgi:acetoin utilization deacetylase AcuC-like enzyme